MHLLISDGNILEVSKGTFSMALAIIYYKDYKKRHFTIIIENKIFTLNKWSKHQL